MAPDKLELVKSYGLKIYDDNYQPLEVNEIYLNPENEQR